MKTPANRPGPGPEGDPKMDPFRDPETAPEPDPFWAQIRGGNAPNFLRKLWNFDPFSGRFELEALTKLDQKKFADGLP